MSVVVVGVVVVVAVVVFVEVVVVAKRGGAKIPAPSPDDQRELCIQKIFPAARGMGLCVVGVWVWVDGGSCGSCCCCCCCGGCQRGGAKLPPPRPLMTKGCCAYKSLFPLRGAWG